MYYEERTNTYYATVHGLENIAKELNNLIPYLRTKKRMKQIARFRKYLKTKRTRHQHQAESALAILDAPGDEEDVVDCVLGRSQ